MGHFINLTLFFMESSNPFLHIKNICLTLKKKDTYCHAIAQIDQILIFWLFRGFWMFQYPYFFATQCLEETLPKQAIILAFYISFGSYNLWVAY